MGVGATGLRQTGCRGNGRKIARRRPSQRHAGAVAGLAGALTTGVWGLAPHSLQLPS
jgi:hypothetical protein